MIATMRNIIGGVITGIGVRVLAPNGRRALVEEIHRSEERALIKDRVLRSLSDPEAANDALKTYHECNPN